MQITREYLLRLVKRIKLNITTICLILALLILGFDFITPSGIADGLLYLTVVLVSFYSKTPFIIWLSTCVCIIFIVIGFFVSPQGSIPIFYISLVNRFLSVLVIFITAILGIQLQSVKNKLEMHKAKLERVNAELTSLANKDGLTGTFNRRYFDHQLFVEHRRTVREQIPLTVMMLDIDFFKSYNDIKGHIAGDNCLIKIAHAIYACLRRPGDILARYGGEEFVMILPGTDLMGARERAEAIRQAVITLDLEHPGSSITQKVTVSLGIGTGQPQSDKDDPNLFVLAADKALYQAKEEGRNCIRSIVVSGGKNNAV